MRNLWDSGRFWFNIALRSSFDVDEIYWGTLYSKGLSEAILVGATLRGKEGFVERKMDQFKGYRRDRERDVRFAT